MGENESKSLCKLYRKLVDMRIYLFHISYLMYGSSLTWESRPHLLLIISVLCFLILISTPRAFSLTASQVSCGCYLPSLVYCHDSVLEI